MITQNDMNKILVEINKILQEMDKRIVALEEQSKKPTSTTAKKTS